MIQLLFFVLIIEGVVAVILLMEFGPLRELVIKSLDQLKTGKGPATVKTIAGTMFVIFLSSLMSIFKVQNKGAKLGTMSPMDQVLWRTHLLEASLMDVGVLSQALDQTDEKKQVLTSSYFLDYKMCLGYPTGFTLLLGFIIDRTHHYLQTLVELRSNMRASKEEVEMLLKEKTQLKEKEEKSSKELKQLKEEISTLSESFKKVKSESDEKDRKVETAEAHVAALQKQAADLLLEYDRLLEDNQNLQNQALGYKS
ncbi:hypothetical protein FEM48_Zijuj05G0184200 [Ziziphus jujuba var. spinosa]|uniref:Endoplasmic reticulum transmembrane protein n=1 Tax=Ziziphus jujuba var. spinosa TaxID=714518 RepID=A0A978VGF1_ZIZJJ|nr:hypothetical protein FEM48_Zijuj05G0184200 [Ziziphus jujuba var. spinosa]